MTFTHPKFIRYLSSGGVTAAQVGRNVPTSANTETFWIIHALGAYNPTEGQSFDIQKNDWCMGNATSISALIYHEIIRDMINTASWDVSPNWVPPSGKPPWIDISEARARVMLHEVLHYFLGLHGTPAADRGIMNTNVDLPNCCLYTGGTHELDTEQIFLIQTRSKPTR